MEETIGYIVIFGLGILFAALYLFKKDKQRLLPIAAQTYPQLHLVVSITKEKRKITALTLELTALKNGIFLRTLQLELSDQLHQKFNIDLAPYLLLPDNRQLSPKEKTSLTLNFEDFTELLETADFSYETLRLVAVTADNKKFKSPLLGYHPRWGIFKADSGKYN